MLDLRTVIIGASEGIGAATAIKFAQKGRDLILVARNETKLQSLQHEIQENYHVKVDYIVCDISDEKALNHCVEILKNYSIETILFNAFYCKLGTFSTLSEHDVLTHLKLNVVAQTVLAHKVLPLIKKGGSIYVTASLASFFIAPYVNLYFSTKHYFLNFFKTLSYELDDIRVKIFCPGFVKTNMIASNLDNKKLTLVSMHTPEQIADYIVNTKSKSRLIHIIGLSNQIFTHTTRFLPDPLFARIFKFYCKKVMK